MPENKPLNEQRKILLLSIHRIQDTANHEDRDLSHKDINDLIHLHQDLLVFDDSWNPHNENCRKN